MCVRDLVGHRLHQFVAHVAEQARDGCEGRVDFAAAKKSLELVIVVHFDGPSVAHRSTGPPGATTAAALPTRPT